MESIAFKGPGYYIFSAFVFEVIPTHPALIGSYENEIIDQENQFCNTQYSE